MQTPFDVIILSDSDTFRASTELTVKSLNNVRLRECDACNGTAIDHISIHKPKMVIIEVGQNENCALTTLATIQTGNEKGRWSSPIHTLLVSRFTPGVVAVLPVAIERGHFDHVLHSVDTEENAPCLQEHIKLKIAAELKRQSGQRLSDTLHGPPQPPNSSLPKAPAEAILIGCSTGGPQALADMLPDLCKQTSAPIFIVQHIHDCFTRPLAEALNTKCEYTIKEAIHDDIVLPKHAYLAPGGRHMLLERRGATVRTIVSDSPPELGCRPSVNILFRSAPRVYGCHLVAAILTGMGTDGTEGALALKHAHATVYAQDEASCVVWGMPGSALHANAVDALHPLNDLPGVLASHTRQDKG